MYEYDDILQHYGVKGMRWGVINEDDDSGSKSSGSSSEHTSNRKANVKKAAIIFGSAAGIAAIAVGSAYVLKNSDKLSAIKIADAVVSPHAKKFVESMAEEPLGIVHAARGNRKGYTFLARGGLTEPILEYAKAGFDQGGVEPFRRYGDRLEKVAASFVDPKGRKDFSGRNIIHDIMLPEAFARGVKTVDEVQALVWPKIQNTYDGFYYSDPNLGARG